MPPIQCRLKSLNIPKETLKKRVLFSLHDSDKINQLLHQDQSKKRHEKQQKQHLETIISTEFYSLKNEFLSRFEHFYSKTYLEIACGVGDFICDMAKKNPGTNFIGIDYALPVIERAFIKAEQSHLDNLLFYLGRVEDFFKYDLKNEMFELVMINFPDPWPKKRHHKRRIVQPSLIKNIDQCLAPNGTLITATDISDLHWWHLEVISANKNFKNIQKDNLDSPLEAYHLASNYELKSKHYNRNIYYTCHVKERWV